MLISFRLFLKKSVDDDDDDEGNGPRPPRTPPHPPYDFLLHKTPLPSPPISDNETERTPAAREKVAIAEKIRFSENLNKLFSKTGEIFNKNDQQESSPDDAKSLSKLGGMPIPQAQVIYKELNEGKLPKQLRVFSVEIVELANLGYMQQIN